MLFSLPQGWTFLFHCSFSRRRQELMQNKPSTNTSHLHHQTITNHKHRPYRDACMRWFVLWGHRDMKCDVFCSVCWFHMAECDTGAAAQWEPLKFRLQNHAGGLTYHLISHRWHQMVITFVWVRGQLEVVWCAAQSLFSDQRWGKRSGCYASIGFTRFWQWWIFHKSPRQNVSVCASL